MHARLRFEVLQADGLRPQLQAGPALPRLLEKKVKIKKLALVPFVLFALAIAASTESTPSAIDSCRSALQNTKAEVPLEAGARAAYLRGLDLTALAQKSLAMASCANTDDEKSSQYALLSGIYNAEEHQRYVHFVERHRLTDKLLKEDAAGDR